MLELILGSLLGGALAVVAMVLGRRSRQQPPPKQEALTDIVNEQAEEQLAEIEAKHAKAIRRLDSKHAAVSSANISEIVDILNSEFSGEEVLDD